MFKITIAQAAKILNLNKKTLLRWEDAGLLAPKREEVSRIRVYDKARIEKIAKWLDLRKRHLEHLRKLDQIRKNLDKFIPKVPLGVSTPKGNKFEDMKKAFGDMKQWEAELDEIDKEYIEFDDFDYGKLEK
mgnify:CR=1 FL=1